MRWFVRLTLTIVVLYCLVITVVLIRIDSQDFIPPLQAWFRDHTGLDLDVQGKLSLDCRPWPVLILRHIQLSNSLQPTYPPVLQAGEFSLGLSVWPLHPGGYALGHVHIQDMILNLASLASSPCASDCRLLPSNIAHIHELRITNATLTGLPAQWGTPTGQMPEQAGHPSASLMLHHLHIDHLGTDTPGALQGSLTSHGPNVTITGSFNSTLHLAQDMESLLVQHGKARMTITRLPHVLNPLDLSLFGTLLIEPAHKRMVLRTLRAILPGLDILTSSTLIWSRPSWKGGIVINANLHELMSNLGLGPASLVRHPDDIDFKAHYTANATTLELQDIHTVIDGQTFHGQGRLTDFTHPKITFACTGDALDVTDYLSGVTSPSLPLPLAAWLKASRIRGRFFANRIQGDKFTAHAVSARIRTHKGMLRIQPIRGRVDKGRIQGKLLYDLTTDQVQGVLTMIKPPSPASITRLKVGGTLGNPWVRPVSDTAFSAQPQQ